MKSVQPSYKINANEEVQHTTQELQKEINDRKIIESILQTSIEDLIQKNLQLTAALSNVELAQAQLIQQEKLAGIGQLAAGVAHEINNPLGFVTVNIEILEQYFAVFSKLLAEYQKLRTSMIATMDPQAKEQEAHIARLEEKEDLDYILNDLPNLFRDTNEGLSRISKIIRGMRLFSRLNQRQVFELYDLNYGIEGTLLVAYNEIKHSATVKTELHPLPMIEVLSSEINQVLLNLIVNAAQAIREKCSEAKGLITLSTWYDETFVYCTIKDNSGGISADNLNNIFNPFFTTKPAGQGTGTELSISYDIIVNRHQGELTVESCLGKGTVFTIKLPILHTSLERSNDSHT